MSPLNSVWPSHEGVETKGVAYGDGCSISPPQPKPDGRPSPVEGIRTRPDRLQKSGFGGGVHEKSEQSREAGAIKFPSTTFDNISSKCSLMARH